VDSLRRIGDGAEKWWRRTKEKVMSLGTILLVILILMLVGVLPTWPHAQSWGYGPSGIVGVVLIIVLVLFLMGRL
jgi:polyferredoxin